jgi:hypothetical protein
MKNIKLGTGIDDIKLGIKSEELEKLIGKPSGIDKAGEEDALELWHYDELNMSFGFSNEFGGSLLTITTSDEDAVIEDVSLIGDTLQEVMDKLEVFGFSDIDIDDISTEDEPNQQLLTVFEYSLNLWFDNDELAEIQWGTFWNIEKDKPVWP